MSVRRNRHLLLAVIVAMAMAMGLAINLSAAMASNHRVEVISGSRKAVLTSTEFSRMKPVSVRAAFLRTTGRIEGPSSYRVVSMADILAQVGGITAAQAIRVTSSDGYSMVYSYSQLQGNVLTYDDKGRALKIGGVEMMLALESDRDGAEKLPRIILADRGGVAITDGHYWAKSVAKIEVIDGVEDWVIKLDGVEKATLDRSAFESIVTCPSTPHPCVQFTTTEKDGTKSVYEGTPLWIVLSMFDGGDSKGGHYVFNDALAKKGYTIRLTSSDGATVDFDSAQVARNNGIILAHVKNGEALSASEGPLRVVGPDLPTKKHSLKQVVKITIMGF